MKNNKDCIKWGLTAFLVILGGLLSYYIIFHLDRITSSLNGLIAILMPIIDGFILAYILNPLVNGIERRVFKPVFKRLKLNIKRKHQRIFAIMITDIIAIACVYLFFSMVIPQIYNSILSIIEQFPSYISELNRLVSDILENNPDIEKSVTSMIDKSSIDLERTFETRILPQINNILATVSVISSSVYSVLKELWNLIIGFIISIYLLASKELFAAQAKKITYAFMPLESANRLINNVRFANKTFGGFFVGKILDSIIIGIICFIVTKILHTPFNVLISVIIGITNIIPFFGPFLGAIPSILLILLVDPVQAFYFLIVIILLQQADGNIIGPKILGSSTGLSSFWVIFSITLFGGIFGIPGMIFGVPVFAIIFAFLKSLIESKLIDKKLPADTGRYLRLLYINTENNNFVDFSVDDNKPFNNVNRILIKHKKRRFLNTNDNEQPDKPHNIDDDLK